MPPFLDRLKHAWNAFTNVNSNSFYENVGYGSSYSQTKTRYPNRNYKTIVTSIYNRLALDVASMQINHVRLDNNGRFLEIMEGDLNDRFNLEANIDQTGRAFIQDAIMSLLEEGVVALLPIDTTISPRTGSYSIKTMRTGQILEWYPEHVKVRAYNQLTGMREDILFKKKDCCIIENPLYSVMNEPNSILQRLIRKLNLLDVVDEQSASGKMDLIIHLPYPVKTDIRKMQAEKRVVDIENQLAGKKYGIAYTDGTEKITQLNRPVENNLMTQVEYLTDMLYSQLGLTKTVLDGTAGEETMLNYYHRTVEPIIAALVDEIKRKLLTKTARSQKQSVMYFRDPFKLVPVSKLAEIGDSFTRNEILSSNDMRQILGRKPSLDPKDDQLKNKNMPVTQTTDSKEVLSQNGKI